MVRKIKVRDIHRCATAYNKIKSRDLLRRSMPSLPRGKGCWILNHVLQRLTAKSSPLTETRPWWWGWQSFRARMWPSLRNRPRPATRNAGHTTTGWCRPMAMGSPCA